MGEGAGYQALHMLPNTCADKPLTVTGKSPKPDFRSYTNVIIVEEILYLLCRTFYQSRVRRISKKIYVRQELTKLHASVLDSALGERKLQGHSSNNLSET